MLKHHRKQENTGVTYITALSGDHSTVSTNRAKALLELNSRDKSFYLNQIFKFDWKSAVVKKEFKNIYRRYPNTDIFWSAGDQMALALVEKIQSLSSKPNKTISVGGFDWLPQALEKINSGEMTASVGGHMLMAGLAVILIKDYHNGTDRFSLENINEAIEQMRNGGVSGRCIVNL